MSLLSYLLRLFKPPKAVKSVEPPHSPPAGFTISPEKQRRIEQLCDNLFRRQDWIASGKLQLIGLGQVRKAMGHRWAGFAPLIFQIVDEALQKFMEEGDLFFRYKEDNYVILFADSDVANSQARLFLIKREIERGLRGLNEPILDGIQLQANVAKAQSAALLGKTLNQTIPLIFMDEQPAAVTPPPQPAASIDIQMPGQAKAASESLVLRAPEITTYKSPLSWQPHDPIPDHAYQPVWDVHKKALTTYMPVFADMRSAENNNEQAQVDRLMLRLVGEELARMRKEGQKFFLLCPVHYNTLVRFSTYKDYKAACQGLPANHPDCLIFLVMDADPMAQNLHFMTPLRKHSRFIFADVRPQENMNVSHWKNVGFDAISMGIPQNGAEYETLPLLTSCVEKARREHINIMVNNIGSLSQMTSIMCAGADYMGGQAIHGLVPQPDNIYRCNHEDIVLSLLGGRAAV